ncbi:SDR family oxidoreductase [Actinospica durhamensis]|uniref:SDR family oxidoreductase n=1 Tax=Actinospica durhamensis TaxID=1508375 RepID=A0A941ISX3_9ACTN|nr:SDR family oxidoreductase [Actinospica durhamensis]MBR7835363.1 SDR family oxidoreductase [Actinospica durhamensis]
MRVFVTGASGFIGSALVVELLGAGHEVCGLARSDAAAEALTGLGAEVLHGTVEDVELLRTGAAESAGVVHLAFNHDMSQHEAAARAELGAVRAFGEVLAGSGRPLVVASGGPMGSERDLRPPSTSPRVAGATAALALAERGVRSSLVRLAPMVHDRGRCSTVETLARIARESGFSGYVEQGANRWPAVHRRDAARLFRLALESAAPGSVLHAVAEEGVPIRHVAEAIGTRLDLPVESVSAEDAVEHFGFLGRLLGLDLPATSEITRAALGWAPSEPGLLADLEDAEFAGS